MPNPFKSSKFKDLIPFFLLAVSIIAAYMIINEIGQFLNFLGRVWSVITPFFYGFILAYILNIPYSAILRALSRIKVKFMGKIAKPLSLIITFLLLAGFIIAVLYMVVPYIYDTVTLFITNLPAYYESALDFIDYINSLELLGLHISIESILERLQEMVQEFSVDDVFSSLNALLAVPSAIFTGFLAFISSIYIMVEKDKFKVYICRILKIFTPDKVSEQVIGNMRKLNTYFKQYIRVQTIDGVILGSIATITLTILGSPFAVVLGIMLGIVNYIPYFGSIVGTLFTVVVIAFTQGFTSAALAAALLLVIQQIDGNVIQPKLMGKSFKFSPLLVIISVTVGGAFAGILGMIAAIPIAATVKDLLENAISNYEVKKFGVPEKVDEPATEAEPIKESKVKKMFDRIKRPNKSKKRIPDR